MKKHNSFLRYLLLIHLVIVFLAFKGFAQEEKDYGIKFSGFIKVDYIYDSRQTIAAREGHFLLFPKKAEFDDSKSDINASPNINILAIQTRLKGTISGPSFFRAKTKGIIEGAFFGQSNSDINGFRLRHAFFNLEWEKIEVLFGQYWHPMFVTSVFPGVYSFNTGAPFQPFSRNPQLRITTKGKLKFIFTIFSQRDFASRGPSGTNSSYLRNACCPGIDFQMSLKSGNFISGAGVDYKIIKPRITNTKGNSTASEVAGLSFITFLRYDKSPFSFKIEGVYGQNLADMLMISGIAETGVDTLTGNYSYNSMKVFSVWSEINAKYQNIEFGVFGGYTKNLGIDDPLQGKLYSLGGDIVDLWRISPRVAWKSGKTKLGIEMEVTQAKYGTFKNGENVIEAIDNGVVTNTRVLLFGKYSF